MKKHILVISLLVTITSCSHSNEFSISEENVGPLTRTTSLRDLEKQFVNDSLVDQTGSADIKNPKGDILVFEKGGKKLLSLSPKENTSESTIKFIQVFDERYTTDQGVTIKSTFKNISDNYEIKNIQNLIGAVIIFVKNSDVYFTIDKKHLPSALMFDADSKIEASQIPDEAPIKYLQIGW